jgi:hypothetical protein
MRMAVSCLVCALAIGHSASRAQEPVRPEHAPVEAGTHVDRFLHAVDIPLVSYRAVRRLEAAARNGRMRATMTAITTLDPETGFRFEVLEENGSGVIRSKVLRAALEAERRTRNSGEAERGALTPINYSFGPAEIVEQGLVRIDIRPLRKDTLLIDGSILLTEGQADLVRLEGQLVKRPSFWTKSVRVVRQYARVGGVRVPVSLESTADVRLVGRSTFSMRYEYEAINATPTTRP